MTVPERLPLLQLHLKNYLVGVFERADQWYDLAALFGFTDIMEGNERLLRSLRFGDDDYGQRIGEVLRDVAQRAPELIERIAKHLELAEHLRQHDARAYGQLYGSAGAALAAVKALGLSSALDVNQEVVRIQRALHDDPEQALGSAKELVEAVLKKILAEHGDTNLSDDMPQLIKRVQKKLDLDPAAVAPTGPGTDALKRMLSGIGQIIHNLVELRNQYGTGHGKAGPTGLEDRHAQLAVTVAGAAATFLMETHLLQKQRAVSTEPLV